MRYRIEYILFQFIKLVILALPLRSAQRFGCYLGSTVFHLSPRRREVALDNLRHAFPEKPDRERYEIAKGSFQNYGIALVELLWFPNLNEERLEKLLHPKNFDTLLEAHARGKGLIVLSGHFGNWELIAFGMAHLAKIPFTIIVQKQNNLMVDRVINEHRCLLGNKVVAMGLSIREIIRTLQDKGVVAIAPDQSGDREGGIYIEFFGRKVSTHQGPAAFALRSGAPVEMGFLIRRQDGTYDVIIEEVPFGDLKGYSEENVYELTRRHLAVLEAYIRRYPDHWMWMHRRWKHVEIEEKIETSEYAGA